MRPDAKATVYELGVREDGTAGGVPRVTCRNAGLGHLLGARLTTRKAISASCVAGSFCTVPSCFSGGRFRGSWSRKLSAWARASHGEIMSATFLHDLRHDFEELARERPDIWAKCYPKVYEGVDSGEYYSAKLLAYFLLSIAVKIERPEVCMYRDFTETVEAVWASRLAAYRVPIFWLTRDITEALKLTTLPTRLDFREMKLPFEAAVFMLPKGSLTYQSEATDVACVSYARTAMCEQIPSINPPIVETISGRGDFSVFAGMSSGRLLNWSHPWEQALDIAELDATIQDTPNEPLRTPFQYDVDVYDKQFMARVAHLVFNTLQLMLAKPNVVSMGRLLKEVQAKRLSRKTFWSPNLVGQDYRLRRASQALGGTHVSPRGHWVRGFWRDQACGPKYSQHRETWIEPFWRGGEQ